MADEKSTEKDTEPIEDEEPEAVAAEPEATPEETPETEEHAETDSGYTRSAVAPYALTLPADLTASDVPSDFEEQLGDFASVAAASGVQAPVAQKLVNAFVEARLDLPYARNLSTDDLLAPDAMENASKYLRGHWGADYDSKLTAARKVVKDLGPRFKTWLVETGKGNDPAVLEALATYASGMFSLTRAQAGERLDKIMRSKEYLSPKSETEGRKLAGTVRALSKIVYAEDAAPTSSTPRGFAAMKAKHASDKASAKAELDEMFKQGSALMDKRAPGHEESVRRMHRLVAVLKP
ncbi:MAG: hypothetical protein ACRD2A_14270 [Vicinamibacterales bacterium]